MRTRRQIGDANIRSVDLISCSDAINSGHHFSLSDEEQFILVDIDPAHVYAFWRFPGNAASGKTDWTFVLRVVSLEGLCLSSTALPHNSNSCYVDLPPNVSGCLAQIGCELADGSFICTATSNQIRLPVVLSSNFQPLPAQIIDAVTDPETGAFASLPEIPPVLVVTAPESDPTPHQSLDDQATGQLVFHPTLLPTTRPNEAVAYDLACCNASSWLAIGYGQ